MIEVKGNCRQKGACGAINQRPCLVTERVPSCNKGLVEYRNGRCLPPQCGKANQRPCLVGERVPSCDPGLVENFAKKKCEVPKRVVCGGMNQRPCKVTERIPSCDKGLREDFNKNKCVAYTCGSENQRPCTVTERIPSCNVGLVENFRKKKCVRLVCGAAGQRACLVTERIPACNKGLQQRGNKCFNYTCGAQNQRACKVTERIPSCNPELVERRGRCVRLACGAQNQRPCKVTERIPSCNEGLVEYANGKCLRPNCGALNQKACKVTVRVPSCDRGLRETAQGTCIVLKPGEIPFLATLGDWSKELAKVSENACITGLERLNYAPSGIGGFPRLQPAQVKYFRIGYTCAGLSKLDQLSGTTAMLQEANRQMQEYPCASVTPVLRPVCALFVTQTSTFGAAATCGIGLAKAGMIRSTGGSVRDTWIGMGRFAWIAADALNLGKNKGKKGGKKPKKGSKEAADAKRDIMDDLLSYYGLSIKYTASAQGFLNGPSCERLN